MRKSITAILAATALAVSGPVAVQAQTSDLPARTGAQMEESNELRGGYIIPATALIGVLLIILALTDTWPFDDEPTSP